MRNSLSYNRLCCLILRDGISRFAEKPVPCPQRAFFMTSKSPYRTTGKPFPHTGMACSAMQKSLSGCEIHIKSPSGGCRTGFPVTAGCLSECRNAENDMLNPNLQT